MLVVGRPTIICHYKVGKFFMAFLQETNEYSNVIIVSKMGVDLKKLVNFVLGRQTRAGLKEGAASQDPLQSGPTSKTKTFLVLFWKNFFSEKYSEFSFAENLAQSAPWS